MKNKTTLAILLLTTALLVAPGTGIAYAHDGEDDGSTAQCEHEHLSQAKKEMIHAALEKSRDGNKAMREELHKLREERNEILGANKFNKDKFLNVTAQIEKKRDQLSKSRAQAFASVADKLTPEERQHAGRMLEHHHRHGGRHQAGNSESKDRREEHKDGVLDREQKFPSNPEQ